MGKEVDDSNDGTAIYVLEWQGIGGAILSFNSMV